MDVKALPSTSRSQFSLGGNLVDEYDPAKPNDYEEVVAERHQQRQEAEREVERQEGLKREAEVRAQLMCHSECRSTQLQQSASTDGEAGIPASLLLCITRPMDVSRSRSRRHRGWQKLRFCKHQHLIEAIHST